MHDNLKKLENLIYSFSVDKSIPMFDINSKEGHIDGENQCSFAILKNQFVYIIAHEDLDILEKYLNLSVQMVKKIEQIRQFSFDIYEEKVKCYYKQLKIIISCDNTIEFSVLGSGLLALRIKLTEFLLTVSIPAIYESTTVELNSSDDINKSLNMALDNLFECLIRKIGFEGNNPYSEDILKFINTPNEQLLIDYFSILPFNYIAPSQLITDSCNDLNYSIESIKLTSENARIPYHMTNLLSNVIKKIIPRKEDSYKMSQLISLINFYYDLINIKPENNSFNISFKLSKKIYIGPNSNLNNVYYSFHIGSEISLYVGYNLKHHNNYYTYILDDNAPEHGTYYKFSSSINKKITLESPKKYETYTDDLDYVYSTILNEIKSHINEKINNIDDTITSRHLDIYKMIVV